MDIAEFANGTSSLGDPTGAFVFLASSTFCETVVPVLAKSTLSQAAAWRIFLSGMWMLEDKASPLLVNLLWPTGRFGVGLSSPSQLVSPSEGFKLRYS